MEEKKILVFSIALEGYSFLFRHCLNTQRNYCKRFGFDYLVVDKAPRPLLAFEAAWLKIFLLRSAIKRNYDWVAFIDADCEIRDHAPSFVKSLSDFKKEGVFMAHGFSGRINSGVIFMKNTAEALDYLEEVIKNGDNKVAEEDAALYENGHMIRYGKNNDHVHIIDYKKWNNNSSFDPDSYIQHYSGGILRGRYLRQHPWLHKFYRYLKRGRRIKRRFSKEPSESSMNNIAALLPYYHQVYAAFATTKRS